MLATSIGLIVICTPFILVVLFKNRLKAFLIVYTALSALHVLLALTTQALHIFTYSVVLAVHIAIALASLYIFFRNRKTGSIDDVVKATSDCGKKTYAYFTTHWFLILMVFLGFFLMYSVRFNYTGIVDTAVGVKHVVDSSYAYPLYSDEWIGASLVDYSIREKTLPLVNPLDAYTPFINFLVASHSLFSELSLVLQFDPISQYAFLAIINSTLLCLAIFLLLRSMSVGSSIAITASISALLITNSGNLPSLWYILPYTASLTFLVFGMIGYVVKNKVIQYTNLIISMLLYPPMIVFTVPFLLVVFFGDKYTINKKNIYSIIKILGLCICSISLILLFSLHKFSPYEIYSRALSFILRPSLDAGKVSFDIWNIIPIYLFPCVLVGLYVCYKQGKKFLYTPIILGLIMWIGYSYTSHVFLIEPSRAIVITSVLLIIVSGLGIKSLYVFVLRKFGLATDVGFRLGIKIIMCIFFALWILNLPKFGLWHKLPMTVHLDGAKQDLIPAPPVTRYLTNEDIELFGQYTGKRFISLPWKGLVIGVATRNYPLESKPSTLTNRMLRYQTFMNADCGMKEKLAKKHDLDLIYSTPFNCPNAFSVLGKSSEGLILYKYLSS